MRNRNLWAWAKGPPTAPCGRNPWYCPFDPTDPDCCQAKAIREQQERADKAKYLRDNANWFDEEYGKSE